MKTGKEEKQQVGLVEKWNSERESGIDVIVMLDDRTEKPARTRSKAYMLGECEGYPGHTAVIQLEGMAGCYRLDRVRPA